MHEKPDSLIHKFLQLQFENPTRGDWTSCCLQDLKDLKIGMSLEEIKIMTENKFKNLLKESIKQRAVEYLTGKQGSKGKEITYSNIKMAEYLMPNSESLSIEDQRNIFEIRN